MRGHDASVRDADSNQKRAKQYGQPHTGLSEGAAMIELLPEIGKRGGEGRDKKRFTPRGGQELSG